MAKIQNTSLDCQLKKYKGIDTLSTPNDVTISVPIIEEIQNDVLALASRQTWTVSYLITRAGEHTIITGSKHPRMKIKQAWVEVKDNSERQQNIELIGITKPKSISKSYKAGVAIPLNLNRTELLFHRTIKVKASTDRLVSIHLLCESMEV